MRSDGIKINIVPVAPLISTLSRYSLSSDATDVVFEDVVIVRPDLLINSSFTFTFEEVLLFDLLVLIRREITEIKVAMGNSSMKNLL